MAYSFNVAWDVRTTGSDSNGGGFNTSSSGTDYSQQNAAQVTYTDLVIGGTNTQITSAAFPFTSAHVGNVINVTGGTGFTVQRVEILSVAAGVATCDKGVGTAASTGGAGKLGGALLTVQLAATLPNTKNIVYIKSGTYTVTAFTQIAGVDQSWVGYNATHNDGGTKPLITTATNSVILFQIGAGHLFLRNISFSNTAATRAVGINANGNFPTMTTMDCIFDGFTICIDSNGGNFGVVSLCNSQFKNYTSASYGVFIPFQGGAHGCYFSGGTNVAAYAIYSNNGITITDCIFASITGGAVHFANGMSCCVVNSSFYAVTKMCIDTGTNMKCTIVNNIFYSCAITGSAAVGTNNVEGAIGYNAFGANGSNYGSPATLYSNFNDITLTANPFTNAAGGDFSLNSTAGGGALCTGLGTPGTFGGTGNTSVVSVGAVQPAGGGGPSQKASGFI